MSENQKGWTLLNYSLSNVPLPPYEAGYLIGMVRNEKGEKSIIQIDKKYLHHLSLGLKGEVQEIETLGGKITFFIPDLEENSLKKEKEENTPVALITGSLRGIGRAIALELADEGIDIIINNSKNLPEGAELLQEIKHKGRKGLYLPADVSDALQVEAMIGQIVSEFGKIDILINNAGITRDKKLENMDVEMWNQVISTNLTGTFNCTKSVIKQMQKQGGGKIINISSIVGETGNFGQANYSAAKGGMIAFTKTVAKEYARDNILVNAVAPGFIKTKMTEAIPPGVLQSIVKQIPLQRFGEAEEVAKLVSFLVSDKANYITGQTFNVNGGLFM